MSSSRETFKHAAIYSMASILAKAVGFVMLPFYAHIMKGVGYGAIDMLDAGMGLLMMLVGYGLNSTYTRFYHEQPEGRKELVVSSGLGLLWMILVPVATLLMIFAEPVTVLLLGDPSYTGVYRLALAAFVLDLTGQAASSILLIQRRSAQFSLISLLRLVIALSLNIWLIVGLRLGLRGYFLSAIITAAVSSIVFHLIAWRTCGRGFDKALAIEMYKFQLPLIPGNLISFFARQAERVLVRAMIGLESVGVLGMAMRYPSLIPLLVTQPFMRSWNTERVRIAEQPDAPAVIGRMYTKFLTLATLAGLLIAVNIRDVLMLLTPEEFWPGWRLARIEVLGLLFAGTYYHVYFGLYYNKLTKTISLLRITVAAFKIALSFLLISLWGLSGAAWSSAVNWALLTIWSGVLAHRQYPIRIEWRAIAAVVVWAAVLDQWCLRGGLSGTALLGWIEGSALPWAADLVAAGPLGGVKDGRIPELLHENTGLLASIAGNTLVALLFTLITPVVHDGVRNRLRRLIRR